jgi:hypothetical protein
VTRKVVAKPGYAVGAITVQFDQKMVRRMKVRFDKINGLALNSEGSYESEWIGAGRDLKEAKLDTEEKLVVGIKGIADHQVEMIGLVHLK